MKARLPIRNAYSAKDQAKSDRANKFIGRGSPASSTEAYRRAWGELANCGHYTKTDVVFVSVEGNRRGRTPLYEKEVLLAIQSNSTIIADKPSDRARPYNIGERELERFLSERGYVEIAPGVWQPSSL